MSCKIHVFDVFYNLRNSARFHPKNAWNRISGTLDFKFSRGWMPPDVPSWSHAFSVSSRPQKCCRRALARSICVHKKRTCSAQCVVLEKYHGANFFLHMSLPLTFIDPRSKNWWRPEFYKNIPSTVSRTFFSARFSNDFGVTVIRHQNADAIGLASVRLRGIHPPENIQNGGCPGDNTGG
jgi:hypothetical protein